MSESCDKTIDFEGFWRGSPKSSFEKRVGGGGWVGVAIIYFENFDVALGSLLFYYKETNGTLPYYYIILL